MEGDAVNRGGYLEVFGAVTGQVVRQAATTVIDSMAEVGAGGSKHHLRWNVSMLVLGCSVS